jgi:hypothetical protein
MTNATPSEAEDAGTTSAPRRRERHAAFNEALLAPVAIFVLCKHELQRAPGSDDTFYLFLVQPVLIAGALGGLAPGLLATALSLVLYLYATGAGLDLIDPGSAWFASEVWRGLRAVRQEDIPDGC